MFERFTDRARRVLVLAQEEARLLEHGFIGVEHILLALVHEHEGVGAVALTGLGVELPALRIDVQEALADRRSPGSVTASPPFTPQAKAALEASLREALARGHNYIGTEHLLLGVVREGSADALLTGLGAGPEAVREEVMRLLGGGGGDGGKNRPPVARCSGCGAALSGALSYERLVATTDEEEAPEPLSAVALFCRFCGALLGVTAADPEAGADQG